MKNHNFPFSTLHFQIALQGTMQELQTGKTRLMPNKGETG